MRPGEVITRKDEPVILNECRECREISVKNVGDRPIQVGSHYHFFEVNRLLLFDRKQTFGFRLDIPSGTSVRFEPGEEKKVALTRLGGARTVYGLRDMTCGKADESTLDETMRKNRENGQIKEDRE